MRPREEEFVLLVYSGRISLFLTSIHSLSSSSSSSSIIIAIPLSSLRLPQLIPNPYQLLTTHTRERPPFHPRRVPFMMQRCPIWVHAPASFVTMDCTKKVIASRSIMTLSWSAWAGPTACTAPRRALNQSACRRRRPTTIGSMHGKSLGIAPVPTHPFQVLRPRIVDAPRNGHLETIKRTKRMTK